MALIRLFYILSGPMLLSPIARDLGQVICFAGVLVSLCLTLSHKTQTHMHVRMCARTTHKQMTDTQTDRPTDRPSDRQTDAREHTHSLP